MFNQKILISEVVLLSMKEGKSSVLPSANERDGVSFSGHYGAISVAFVIF